MIMKAHYQLLRSNSKAKMRVFAVQITLLKLTRLRESVILADCDVFAPADAAFAVLG